MESEQRTVIQGPFTFILKKGIATLWEFNDKTIEHLEIPSEVEGCPLVFIAHEAFKRGQFTQFKTVSIPNTVRYIGEFAFNGCRFLETIEIPSSVEAIGQYAFAGCLKMNSIIIPSTVTDMGAEVFFDCDKVVIKVYENSYAHEYVKANNLSYEIIAE